MKKNSLRSIIVILVSLFFSTNSFAQNSTDSSLLKKLAILESQLADLQKQINQLKNKPLFETAVAVDRRGSKQPIFPKK